MAWDKRYFKGREVWVETDHEGEPIVEDGRVFVKYDREADAKIYTPHADKVQTSPEDDREAWLRRLEERERELDERKRRLDAREQSLDDRAQALEEWESDLKERGIAAVEDEQTPEETIEFDGTRRDGAPAAIENLDPPEEDVVEFHTDGACSGNPGPCAAAAVCRRGDEYSEWAEFLGDGTNNIAELEAIRSALASVDDRSRPVRIYTDSRYAIGVLTKGWKARANRELIEETRALLDEFDDVELRKVEGHAGEPLNERADDLAKSAIPD